MSDESEPEQQPVSESVNPPVDSPKSLDDGCNHPVRSGGEIGPSPIDRKPKPTPAPPPKKK